MCSFFKARDFENAVECYSKALDLCPFGEDSHYARSVFYGNRAQCFLSMGEPEDAILDCDDALKLQPRFVKALMRRSQAHENLGHLEDALAGE